MIKTHVPFLLAFDTKKSGKSTESLARNHDYVLVYGKNDNAILRGTLHTDVGFSHQDEFFEQRGAFKLNQTLDYNTLGYVLIPSFITEFIINLSATATMMSL